MNEETILQGQTMANGNADPNNEQSNSSAWKQVSIGGVAGILMGAGAMYAANAYAAGKEEVPAEDADGQDGAQPEGVKVAEVSDNMSFKEAFDAARGQVGAGGVFRWHGGIYNTYTADEWNSMSDAEKSDFAELVKPEVTAAEIDTTQITEATPDVHVHVHIHEAAPVAQPASNPSGGEDPWEGDDDVRLVARGEYEGHKVYGYDVTGDDKPDVAVINMGPDNIPTPDDLVVLPTGETARLGEVDEMAQDPTQDPNIQATSYDNPDVAPDMPDYSNNADIDVIG